MISKNGRTLKIVFKCGRCGKEAMGDYKENSQYDVCSNMGTSPLPDGWWESYTSLPQANNSLLCPDCYVGLAEYIRGGKYK